MRNVRPAFEVWEKDVEHIPPGYHCHMIFNVKMGKNFRRKARFVTCGHTTEMPMSLTYSSVVSQDSVRIILLTVALNRLQVMACDIQNAYLTANCREKIWTYAGPEFGSERGQPMIIRKALYGLKSSGTAFRAHLAERFMTSVSSQRKLIPMFGSTQQSNRMGPNIMSISCAMSMIYCLSHMMRSLFYNLYRDNSNSRATR